MAINLSGSLFSFLPNILTSPSGGSSGAGNQPGGSLFDLNTAGSTSLLPNLSAGFGVGAPSSQVALTPSQMVELQTEANNPALFNLAFGNSFDSVQNQLIASAGLSTTDPLNTQGLNNIQASLTPSALSSASSMQFGGSTILAGTPLASAVLSPNLFMLPAIPNTPSPSAILNAMPPAAASSQSVLSGLPSGTIILPTGVGSKFASGSIGQQIIGPHVSVAGVNTPTAAAPAAVAAPSATDTANAAFNQQLSSFDSQFGALFQLGASLSPVAQDLFGKAQQAQIQEQQLLAQQAQQQAVLKQQLAQQAVIQQQQQAAQKAQQQAALNGLVTQLTGLLSSLG